MTFKFAFTAPYLLHSPSEWQYLRCNGSETELISTARTLPSSCFSCPLSPFLLSPMLETLGWCSNTSRSKHPVSLPPRQLKNLALLTIQLHFYFVFSSPVFHKSSLPILPACIYLKMEVLFICFPPRKLLRHLKSEHFNVRISMSWFWIPIFLPSYLWQVNSP